MAKTRTPKKKTGNTVLTPNICNNFSGSPGDTVQWQQVPASGCKISQDGTKTWPFTPGPPINNVLTAGTIKIRTDLPTTQTYYFVVECCVNEATKSVYVG
jgi:hypothetical protein